MEVNYVESIRLHLNKIRRHLLDIEMFLAKIEEKRR